MPNGAISAIARAGLPAARQAARAILARGGRLLGGAAAIGVGTAVGQKVVQMPTRFAERMPRRRRARGITAAELRGARKVAKLVQMYGYRPKAGKIRGRKR